MSSFSNSSSLLTRLLVIFLFVSLIDYSSADECSFKIPPNTTCTITKSFNNKSNLKIIQVLNLKFHSKDNLTVSIKDKNEPIELFMNGFIVLPKDSTNVTFTVSTSADNGTRSFQTFNALNESRLSVNGLTKFTILFQNTTYSDPIIIESDLAEAATILSSDSQGVTAVPMNGGDEDKDNKVDLSKQDLLTNLKKIKLTLSSNSIYHFSIMKVDASCSRIIIIEDKPVVLATIDKDAVSTQSEYHCAYQLTTQNKGNVQIDSLVLSSTVNSYDEIVVKDGLKLTGNDLINTKAKYAPSYLNSLDKTVSTTDGLTIILSSTFVSPDYQQSNITVKKATIKRNDHQSDFNIEGEGDLISIFTLNDSYPLLKFKSNLKLTAKLEVYDSLVMSKAPIITFAEGETMNSELWSGTNVIVLKFSNSKNLKIEGKFTNYKNDCNKIVNEPSTFVINGNENLANQSCSFYFKPKERDHSVILNIQSLILIDDSSCLTLKSVGDGKEEEQFKICQAKDVKDNLERNHLPELVLSPNSGHVLTYQFSSQFKKKTLLQASFSYNALKILRPKNLTELESCSLSSLNYPNNYPYILNQNELDTIVSDKYIYGSIEKLDLRPNDRLKSIPEFNYTYGLIDDFVLGPNVTFPVYPLETKFDSQSLTANSFAQGFKINFEEIACKLELDANNVLKTNDKIENATKCVAIINLSEKNKPKYLKVTIENSRNEIDYGKLIIYDGATKQTNLSNVFEPTLLKSNQTINLNTTSTKLVVIFDPLGKQTVNGFKMTIKTEDCPKYANATAPGVCDEGTRCILESIRCNYHTECLDKSDEKSCVNNGIYPAPHVDPETKIVYRGLSGWWITLVIIPLSMFAGALVFKHGPRMMTRFRGHSYQEFNTFSENA